MREAYQVKLEVFEGPLDLLYHLVEREEIDIWDIPIARITEQYLAYLDTMQKLDIEVAAEFLVMAARLLYIKAKMLLPEAPPESPDGEDDPRLDLAAALIEYKIFKDAAHALEARGEGRWALVSRPEISLPAGSVPVYEDPIGNVTVYDLARAFMSLLRSRTPSTKPIPVPRNKVSVTEKIASLRRLFARRRSVVFTSLFRRGASRPEVVATFLALLELIRRGFVVARQEGSFAPLIIERVDHDAPWDAKAEAAAASEWESEFDRH